MPTPVMNSLDQFEEYEEEVSKVYRPPTPKTHEELLQGFDMRKQKISSLIASQDDSVDLATESKPLRETL